MSDITATLLTSGQSETDTTVYSTASVSPGTNKLLLAIVNGLRLSVAVNSAPTCAGLGLTWIEVGTVAYEHGVGETGRTRMSIFAAFGSGSTGAVTFTFLETNARATFAIVEFENTVKSIGAVIQLVISAEATSTNPVATLAAFAESVNATFGATGWSVGNPSVTEGAGFTELSENRLAPNGTGLQTQFRLDNDTSVDVTYGSAVRNVVFGIELGNEFVPATEKAAADTLDLAIINEVKDLVNFVPKVVVDTLGLEANEVAEALAVDPSSLVGVSGVALSDFGEFGASIPFAEIENDPPDAIALADVPPVTFVQAPAFSAKTLMIAEIKLTGGTLFRAGKGIRHPTRMYVGKIKSFGSIIRSIQVPSGLAQIGDAEITIIDTDGELRRLMSGTPPQNREIVIKIGGEGESEAIFQIAYTGIIVHATFPPGLAKIRVQDNTFKFLQEKLPDLLTRENFTPDPVFARNLRGRTEGAFDESEIFSPIVFGILDSTGLDVIGSMNAVRLDSTTFNLAQHPIPHAPIRIFIKDPDNRPEPDQEFVEQIGGFSIVEVAKTIDGIDYVFTHVVFGTGQATGFEVRWDGEGMTDDDTEFGNVIRDPAEAIKQYLIRIARRDPTEIDLIGFADTGETMAAIDTGGQVVGFFCDGAITQRLFHREALARMTRSFGLFLFTDKNGRITIRYIGESDPDRPVLDDVQDIYVHSETHQLARPIVNEVNLQYIRMFSEQSWQGILTVTDDDSVEALERVESKDLKLFFVRDDFVADRVARDFLQFTNPGSFRIVMTIPGHRRTGEVELAQLIGITNYSGLDPFGGGYKNKEFLIHKTEFRTDSKDLRIHAVARLPSPDRTISQTSEWITITNGSGQDVEGGYKELIASTRDLGTWVLCQVRAGPGFNEVLFEQFDLAIGSLGQEVNFINDMVVSSQSQGVGMAPQQDFSFPFRIASGSRISARTKGTSLKAYQIIVHVNG